MPFLSYHASLEETFQSAKSLMQDAQADAVKLEGAGEVVTAIDKLTNAGVPVMAHLGLMPQSVGVLGGYKVQGKDEESAARLLEDTKAVEAAGAFAVVLECVPESVAGWITEQVNIPVIGIGAGVQTDGQVLVYHDVIGYGSGHVPKFVKKYANVADTIGTAVTSYVEEVKAQKFPQKEHSFHADVKQVQLYGGK